MLHLTSEQIFSSCAAVNDDMFELEKDQKGSAKERRKPKFVGPLKGPN